jgi:hypothetical protein
MQNQMGPLPARERIRIANYHWNPDLLEFMTNENMKRTTPISKRAASKFGITSAIDSVSHEGIFFSLFQTFQNLNYY